MSEKITTAEQGSNQRPDQRIAESVEEMLSELLEAEAEKLTQAIRSERNKARLATMTGTLPRPLATSRCMCHT